MNSWSVQHVKDVSSTPKKPWVQHIRQFNTNKQSVLHKKRQFNTKNTVSSIQKIVSSTKNSLVLNWRFLLNWRVCWTDSFLWQNDGCVEMTFFLCWTDVFLCRNDGCVEMTFFCAKLMSVLKWRFFCWPDVLNNEYLCHYLVIIYLNSCIHLCIFLLK